MFLNTYIISLLSFLFLCVMPIHASHAQEKDSTSKANIGIFIFKLDDVYIHSVSEAIESALENKAIFTTFDAKNEQNTQTEQLNTFLSQHVDAVAINLVDIKESQKILNIVQKKNIPVIFFNKEPNLNILKAYPQARYVGTEPIQAGLLQGEIIANLWKTHPEFDRNKDGTCHFIMYQGGLDNPEALFRTRSSVQRARELGINMQQIGDTLICDWDATCAYGSTKLIFESFKDEVDFIISNNDDMAIGAILALNEYGFNKEGGTYIPVVGVDAIEKARSAIRAGSMHGTVLQDAQAMGNAVATMLLNASQKKPLLRNLKYTWDESGLAIRIPYKTYP